MITKAEARQEFENLIWLLSYNHQGQNCIYWKDSTRWVLFLVWNHYVKHLIIHCTFRWKAMSDYNSHCTANQDSAIWSIKKRHHCRQTGSFFLDWKKCCSYLSAGEVLLTFCISGYDKDRRWTLVVYLYIKQHFKHATPNKHPKTQKRVRTLNCRRRCRRKENLGFIIAHCTNECLQLIPLRFLETILSHVEILFGAICHGKRDRIYYLLHSIIAGPGVLPRWESRRNPYFWRGNTLGPPVLTTGLGWGLRCMFMGLSVIFHTAVLISMKNIKTNPLKKRSTWGLSLFRPS